MSQMQLMLINVPFFQVPPARAVQHSLQWMVGALQSIANRGEMQLNILGGRDAHTHTLTD